MNAEHRPQRRKRKSRRAHNKAIPLVSTFDELFRGGTPVWLKIVVGAVATPILVLVCGLRANRRGGTGFPNDPIIIAAIFGGSAIVGAVLGAALSLKDVVQSRLADGKPVAFPLRALFGFGIWSLLLVWVPGIIALTLVVTMLVLG